MSNVTQFPDLSRAREQAADWISRASRGLSVEERAEFALWRSNPVNARALQQLGSLWAEMDVLRELSHVIPEPPSRQDPGPARSRSWRPMLAAALVLGVLAAGMVLRQRGASAPEQGAVVNPTAGDFITRVGEEREVALPDGSRLAINTASQVQVVALGRESRELRLVRGEAHFTVAHDPSRPFRVAAAGHVVQALGTAFNVRLLPGGGLEVIVTEGHVKLLSGNGAVGELSRDEYLRVSADGTSKTGQLDESAVSARLAWRNGMLVFDGQSLADALAEFSRYTEERFVIRDRRLGDVRIGGFFAAGDTAALREALKANFGIESRTAADGVILIGPEPGAASGQ